MPLSIPLLDETLDFPPVEKSVNGLVAVGGDLSPARLIAAYEAGIFPWYNEDDPPLWWCPEERAILPPEEIRVSKSMRSVLRNAGYSFTMDEAFSEVMAACREVRTEIGEETWISDEILVGYRALHDLGMAHSVETWHEGQLVGGLYGVSIGRMFFGESMFSRRSNASKAAFIQLAKWLEVRGFGPIDCQIQNPHLSSLGAFDIPRSEFLGLLPQFLSAGPTLKGKWTFDAPFKP